MAKQSPILMEVGPNGSMPISLGWAGAFHEFKIVGGPFDAFASYDRNRDNAFGVCVRAERAPKNLDLHLPIHDFDVPRNDVLTKEVVKRTIAAALEGKDVYVGCMGGWGRTGLVLALIAKASGVADPVAYVRKHYTPRAVETQQQKEFVDRFDVTELQRWLFWAGWQKRTLDTLLWWKCN